MSASPSHRGGEVEVKDADLVHRSAPPDQQHQPAAQDDRSSGHDNGTAVTDSHPAAAASILSPGVVGDTADDDDDDDDQDHRQQPQPLQRPQHDEAQGQKLPRTASIQDQQHHQHPQTPQHEQPLDDHGGTEDDSIMQGHPATQEQAQYETEVKEQDRWLPIANGRLAPTPVISSPLSPPCHHAPVPQGESERLGHFSAVSGQSPRGGCQRVGHGAGVCFSANTVAPCVKLHGAASTLRSVETCQKSSHKRPQLSASTALREPAASPTGRHPDSLCPVH
ncbi:MAG: hypothetical protein Q9162_000658 [Coniocarpon cinnabarinum]